MFYAMNQYSSEVFITKAEFPVTIPDVQELCAGMVKFRPQAQVSSRCVQIVRLGQ